MQAADCTISDLSDVTDQVFAGIGDVDLSSFKIALERSFSSLQCILQKKVSLGHPTPLSNLKLGQQGKSRWPFIIEVLPPFIAF